MELATIAAIGIYVFSLLVGGIGMLFADNFSAVLNVNRVKLLFGLIGFTQTIWIGALLLFRLWVPHPIRLALVSVRFCRLGAWVTFAGPLTLVGMDNFIARLPGGFEIRMEHAGATAVAGTFLCLYYMNKFEDRFDRLWRQYQP